MLILQLDCSQKPWGAMMEKVLGKSNLWNWIHYVKISFSDVFESTAFKEKEIAEKVID